MESKSGLGPFRNLISSMDYENQTILRVGVGVLKPSSSSVFASLGAFGVHIFTEVSV